MFEKVKSISDLGHIHIETIKSILIFDGDNVIMQYENDGTGDLAFHVDETIVGKNRLKRVVIEGKADWFGNKSDDLKYVMATDSYII